MFLCCTASGLGGPECCSSGGAAHASAARVAATIPSRKRRPEQGEGVACWHLRVQSILRETGGEAIEGALLESALQEMCSRGAPTPESIKDNSGGVRAPLRDASRLVFFLLHFTGNTQPTSQFTVGRLLAADGFL